MRTIEEVFNAEGLKDEDGNSVMSVEYLEFIGRWVAGKLKESDAPMLAMAYGEKINGEVA